MSIKTVKVSNLSLGASERDVREFFSFSGDIVFVETKSHDERSQIAFVTFTDSQGAETAVLLSGATIVDTTVTVTLDPEYQLPPAATTASRPIGSNAPAGNDSALRKAEDVVTSMFAKGFVLGKDAIGKAKTFDKKHRLTSTASAKVASIDNKIGFTEKVNMGTSIVSDKVKEVDQKLQVSEKAKSVLTAAENTVTSAGSLYPSNYPEQQLPLNLEAGPSNVPLEDPPQDPIRIAIAKLIKKTKKRSRNMKILTQRHKWLEEMVQQVFNMEEFTTPPPFELEPESESESDSDFDML